VVAGWVGVLGGGALRGGGGFKKFFLAGYGDGGGVGWWGWKVGAYLGVGLLGVVGGFCFFMVGGVSPGGVRELVGWVQRKIRGFVVGGPGWRRFTLPYFYSRDGGGWGG